MSEIRATTISDAAGTGPIALTKQSAAKAWVNFNGVGTVAVRDSENVSSLTDNGTGDYSFSFISNVTYPYSFQGSSGDHTSTSTTIRVVVLAAETEAPTSSGFRVFSFTSAVAKFDTDYGFITIHGDLA